MAIANSDGSIILSTKVDTSGMEQGTKSLKSQAAKLAAEYRKAGMSQSEAFKKAWSEIERTRKETEKATKSTQTYGEKAKTAFQGVGSALKSLAGYLALAFSVTKIIQFSNEAGQLATQTEASVQRLVDIYGSASDSVGDFIDANARALGMSKAAAASFSSVYGNLFSVWADQATNAELTNRYLQMTAVVASKTGRTVEDVQERVRSGLLGNTEAIEDLGIFVNVKTIEMTDAFQRMADGKSWEQLDAYTQQQIRSMAILEQATAKYGDEVAETSATMRNQYKAAYEDFKNSWGNIVNTVLLPVLQVLTQIFDIATKGLNAISSRSGEILENIQLQEENTDKTAENIKEQTKNQKDLNKELKKSLAGFDEIQILSSSNKENIIDDVSTPNIPEIENAEPKPFSNEVNGQLQAIMAVISGALVAIGVMLIYFGQVSYGIGFIIAGAATFTVTAASIKEGIPDGMWTFLSAMMAFVNLALIVIGIILVATGAGIPLGIGFIIAGAAGMVSVVALNWDTVSGILNGLIEKWKTSILFGIGLVVLGVLLLSIAPPAGIALIFAGVSGIVSAVSLHWDTITQTIKTIFNNIIDWIKTYGLLVLGVLLCLTGTMIPVGIALIIKWVKDSSEQGVPLANKMKEKVQEILNPIMDWIKSYGLLVLGILLCLTSVGFPFGIALLIKWAKDGAENGVPLATAIVDKVKEAWNAVKAFWNSHIAHVFSLKWWGEKGKNIGNGLIDGFEGAVNSIIGIFETMINWIVTELNKISIDVPSWVPVIGGKTFGFDLSTVKFDRLSIPRLAQGTVVPPNREFLSILGDNTKEHEIVSPISTMKQAFMEAMYEMGGTGHTTKEEHYYLSETEVMTIIYKLAKGGERLNGTSLINGGAY